MLKTTTQLLELASYCVYLNEHLLQDFDEELVWDSSEHTSSITTVIVTTTGTTMFHSLQHGLSISQNLKLRPCTKPVNCIIENTQQVSN